MRVYWEQSIKDVIIPLWEKERDRDKILSMFPNVSWSAIRCKMSELGIKRLSKVTTLPKLRTLNLTETEKAYLAGFIDGEGCISLYPQYKKGSNQYHGRLQITNTNKDILVSFQKMLGFGGLRYHPRKDGWKDGYTLQINSNSDIYVLLNLLIPYLIVKREQAILLVKFILSRFLSTPKWNMEVTLEQEFIYQRIKQLNKKGK